MDDQLLNEKIKELRRHKRAMEELQHKIDGIKSEIKAEMERRGVEQLITEEHKITWRPVSSMTLDITALREERPEIYARYAAPVTSRPFVIT